MYVCVRAAAAKQGLDLAGLTVIFAPMGDASFDPESLKPAEVTAAEDFFDLDFLLKLFEYRTVTAVYVSMHVKLTAAYGFQECR
jgi:hypothetical protein